MPVDPTYPDPERITTQADFGRELKALREGAGLKIREVAKASGAAAEWSALVPGVPYRAPCT